MDLIPFEKRTVVNVEKLVKSFKEATKRNPGTTLFFMKDNQVLSPEKTKELTEQIQAYIKDKQ